MFGMLINEREMKFKGNLTLVKAKPLLRHVEDSMHCWQNGNCFFYSLCA